MDGNSMRLKNRETGEIPEKIETIAYLQWAEKIMMVYINSDGERIVKLYDSLGSFNEEWGDVPEEPKWFRDYWFIDSCGSVIKQDDDVLGDARREIGNYFSTREEAEAAVEKLRAFKRLKNKGFKFGGWEDCDSEINTIYFSMPENKWGTDACDDLNLLFGSEE